MVQSKKYAPPNCQILIFDPEGRYEIEVPPWRDEGILWTDTCIVCACQADIDGETEFTVGTPEEVNPGGQPVFQGTLKTPGCWIVLETVEGNVILEAKTANQETTVLIWTNHEIMPSKVAFGII